MGTMLVHKDLSSSFLPAMIGKFIKAGVEVKGCAKTKAIVPEVKAATDKDWDTEYNDLVLNVKVVDSMGDAMGHIAAHGSQHSEAIVTNDYAKALRFQREVDASAVFVNASTRLNDGYEFGLGGSTRAAPWDWRNLPPPSSLSSGTDRSGSRGERRG
jgi:glutamate-5-semialdehyde dehydrogenase